MVLGAKHMDRILTQFSRESQNAAKLIPHELLEISSGRFPFTAVLSSASRRPVIESVRPFAYEAVGRRQDRLHCQLR
jgi:hypothetical protein